MSSSRAVGVFFAGWLAAANAAEPTFQHLYPVAGEQGTKVAVTASGKFDPWPPQVWVDAPGITFQPGKGKGKFDVEIAKDAAPGPHLVRLYNNDGASAPRFFIVSATPELADTEPNDHFKTAQKIAFLPATISGRLDKAGDVDSFAVTMKKGQTFKAAVEAYVLGSTFDGLLRILDEDGTPRAFNHDGRTLDPAFVWTAPGDGTFIVQLMGFAYPATASVNMTGGDGCVYRLHLTTGSTDAAALTAAKINVGGESPEKEPNDAAGDAQPITVPAEISGAIEKPGDEDRFTFTAVKKTVYEFRMVGARAGSPLDAWLKIENKDGKELAKNDDADGSPDPRLTWTAPSDGVFTVAVGDVTHRGGHAFIYRLAVVEARASVTATTASHAVTVAAGKTGDLKVAVKRLSGFTTKLQLAAKGLPDGVTAPAVDVPEKGGDVTLKINADASAVAASQPLQIILRETDSGTEHPVSYSMTTTGENNGVPQGYTELVIGATDQLWLTVSAAPAEPETAKPEAAATAASK